MVKATIGATLMRTLVPAFTAVVPAGVDVRLGYGVTDSPADYVLVGADDPFSDQPAPMVDGDSDFLYTGAVNRTENGGINCVAFVSTGDTDTDIALTRLEEVLDALATALRADPDLTSIPELMWCHLSVTRIDSDQNRNGTWALGVFRVLFKAQL